MLIHFQTLQGFVDAQAGIPAEQFQDGSIDPQAIIGMFQANERLHVFFGDRYSIILKFQTDVDASFAHGYLQTHHIHGTEKNDDSKRQKI